jgi:aspartyl-tRNA synthetase
LSLGPLRFRRITGFPMFELHEETGQVASAACWTRSAKKRRTSACGAAPRIDRIVTLPANEPSIREVILFRSIKRGEDLMMGAPAEVPPARLKEPHLRVAERGISAGAWAPASLCSR